MLSQTQLSDDNKPVILAIQEFKKPFANELLIRAHVCLCAYTDQRPCRVREPDVISHEQSAEILSLNALR